MLILYLHIRRFMVDLKSYFTMLSSDLYAAVRNAILENNIAALEQLRLSLNEDYRAASTMRHQLKYMCLSKIVVVIQIIKEECVLL